MSKMINKAINTTLNSSTYTEIKASTQDLYGFTMFAHESGTMTEFYLAWSSAGENATLMPATGFAWRDFQPNGSTICWAKAVSGTPVLVVVPARYTSYK